MRKQVPKKPVQITSQQNDLRSSQSSQHGSAGCPDEEAVAYWACVLFVFAGRPSIRIGLLTLENGNMYSSGL